MIVLKMMVLVMFVFLHTHLVIPMMNPAWGLLGKLIGTYLLKRAIKEIRALIVPSRVIQVFRAIKVIREPVFKVTLELRVQKAIQVIREILALAFRVILVLTAIRVILV